MGFLNVCEEQISTLLYVGAVVTGDRHHPGKAGEFCHYDDIPSVQALGCIFTAPRLPTTHHRRDPCCQEQDERLRWASVIHGQPS